jgi:hypothetical protein
LQFAGRNRDGDFDGFEQGKFRFSPLVHAFRLEELRELFAGFEIEELQRCTIIDELREGTSSEVFRVVARRRA